MVGPVCGQRGACRPVLVLAALAIVAATDGTGSKTDVCPASSQGPPPAPLRRFRWVHFPKAGTSMAILLFHYVCKGNIPEGEVHYAWFNG